MDSTPGSSYQTHRRSDSTGATTPATGFSGPIGHHHCTVSPAAGPLSAIQQPTTTATSATDNEPPIRRASGDEEKRLPNSVVLRDNRSGIRQLPQRITASKNSIDFSGDTESPLRTSSTAFSPAGSVGITDTTISAAAGRSHTLPTDDRSLRHKEFPRLFTREEELAEGIKSKEQRQHGESSLSANRSGTLGRTHGAERLRVTCDRLPGERIHGTHNSDDTRVSQAPPSRHPSVSGTARPCRSSRDAAASQLPRAALNISSASDRFNISGSRSSPQLVPSNSAFLDNSPQTTLEYSRSAVGFSGVAGGNRSVAASTPRAGHSSVATKEKIQRSKAHEENRRRRHGGGTRMSPSSGAVVVSSAQLYRSLSVRKPRRRALVIGCNYSESGNIELQGAVNDATLFSLALVNLFNFHPRNILLLTDSTPDEVFFGAENPAAATKAYLDIRNSALPVRTHITLGLQWLITGAQPGDCLAFYFAGHGLQVDNMSGWEGEGYDECILPMDCSHRNGDVNALTTVGIRNVLLNVPEEVQVSMFLDCAGGQTILDPTGTGRWHYISGVKQKGIWPFITDPTDKMERARYDANVWTAQSMRQKDVRPRFVPGVEVTSTFELMERKGAVPAGHRPKGYLLAAAPFNQVAIEAYLPSVGLQGISPGGVVADISVIRANKPVHHGIFTWALVKALNEAVINAARANRADRKVSFRQALEGLVKWCHIAKSKQGLDRLNQMPELTVYKSSNSNPHDYMFYPFGGHMRGSRFQDGTESTVREAAENCALPARSSYLNAWQAEVALAYYSENLRSRVLTTTTPVRNSHPATHSQDPARQSIAHHLDSSFTNHRPLNHHVQGANVSARHSVARTSVRPGLAVAAPTASPSNESRERPTKPTASSSNCPSALRISAELPTLTIPSLLGAAGRSAPTAGGGSSQSPEITRIFLGESLTSAEPSTATGDSHSMGCASPTAFVTTRQTKSLASSTSALSPSNHQISHGRYFDNNQPAKSNRLAADVSLPPNLLIDATNISITRQLSSFASTGSPAFARGLQQDVRNGNPMSFSVPTKQSPTLTNRFATIPSATTSPCMPAASDQYQAFFSTSSGPMSINLTEDSYHPQMSALGAANSSSFQIRQPPIPVKEKDEYQQKHFRIRPRETAVPMPSHLLESLELSTPFADPDIYTDAPAPNRAPLVLPESFLTDGHGDMKIEHEQREEEIENAKNK